MDESGLASHTSEEMKQNGKGSSNGPYGLMKSHQCVATLHTVSVTRLGDFLLFGQLFKAFGIN